MTPASRAPLWRAVQLVAGVALFLFALRQIAPLPLATMPFVLLAALLAAGAMAVTDSVVGLLAALFDKLLKGRRA
jgi:hypothetical protein